MPTANEILGIGSNVKPSANDILGLGATITEPEPPPFDFEMVTDSWIKTKPTKDVPSLRESAANLIYGIARPFLAQGYNSLSAMNRGSAYFFEMLDSAADFASRMTGMEKSGGILTDDILKKAAKMGDEAADYWKDRANKVSSNVIDEFFGELFGGFMPGTAKFAMSLASGLTLPAMAGAEKGYRAGENQFVEGFTEAARTGMLGYLFHYMAPLRAYLKSPIMGTVFGIDAAAQAPEGKELGEFVKGFGTGLAYGISTPGGRLGLNELRGKIRENPVFKEIAQEIAEKQPTVQPVVESPKPPIAEPGKVGERELPSSEPAKISENQPRISASEPKPPSGDLETKRAKLFERVEEKKIEMAPEVSKILSEADAEERQIYYTFHNKEKIAEAEAKIATDGLQPTLDFVLSDNPFTSEKSHSFIAAIREAERTGDYDLAARLYDNLYLQGQEAGRFVQAICLLTTANSSPYSFLRRIQGEVDRINENRGWLDTILGRKEFKFSKDELSDILRRKMDISKMPDGPEKAQAMRGLYDDIAEGIPPSVAEYVDAFRYQNMLSGWQTQLRNIENNIFNTYITRPYDLAIKGGIDYIKAGLFGKAREAYVNDVPLYLKEAINAMPNAVQAFKLTWKGELMAKKPDMGAGEVKTEIQQARQRNLPKSLTVVQRFMEASDRFNSMLIASGQKAVDLKNGMSLEEANTHATDVAETYLYRSSLQKTADLSIPSKALAELGQLIIGGRRYKNLGKPLQWYVPFVTTPVNVGIQMIEHSPLGFARTNWSSEAVAKTVGGSIISGLGGLLAFNGDSTWAAPTNEEEKKWFYATGRKPYSLKVGNYWVPLWYFGPFAFALGLPAAIKHYSEDSKMSLTDDASEKIIKSVTSIVKFIGSQSSVQSLGNFFSAVSGDIDFTFEGQAAFAMGQFIPASSFMRGVSKMIDPMFRKPTGFWENVQKDLPWLSKELPGRKTPFELPSVRDTSDLFLPWAIGKTQPEYEALYPTEQMEMKERYLENKLKSIDKKFDEGELTADNYVKQMKKVLEAMPKSGGNK